jgi:hypothetical protein|tara:strand:+ start:11792 stop:11947 length:156 start_codon:yes stop_codon:yes gene_type:complete
VVFVTFDSVSGASGFNPSAKAVFKIIGYITANISEAAAAGLVRRQGFWNQW